jgi:hypothetical protein
MGCGGREGSFCVFGVPLPFGISRSLLMPQPEMAAHRPSASNKRKIMRLSPGQCDVRLALMFVNFVAAVYLLLGNEVHVVM